MEAGAPACLQFRAKSPDSAVTGASAGAALHPPLRSTMVTSGTTPQIDGRREPRYNVAWRARIELPDGSSIDAKVRDISTSGIGLVSEYCATQGGTLRLVLGVPDLVDPTRILAVPASLKVMFVVMQGRDFRVGGLWSNIGPLAEHFLQQWVTKLRIGL